MSILDRFFGLLAALAYALERAKIGFLRLRVGAMVLCCLFAASATYRRSQDGFSVSHGTSVALCLLATAALYWANNRHYIVFREHPVPPTAGTPDLHADEKLLLRGSGIFAVNDMTRYLVEVPVVFWATQLADHIVAARVRALNVLGVGVPSEERGWWYMFIEPKEVLEVTPGYLCFGLGTRPTVCVRRATERGYQRLYLSCHSQEQQARLLKELQTKAQSTRPCAE